MQNGSPSRNGTSNLQSIRNKLIQILALRRKCINTTALADRVHQSSNMQDMHYSLGYVTICKWDKHIDWINGEKEMKREQTWGLNKKMSQALLDFDQEFVWSDITDTPPFFLYIKV